MIINDTIFNADVTDIINELRAQLVINQIPLLNHIKDTPDNVMVSCIYHKGGQERKPSAGIKKSDGTYHCFACGEVHSLPEVVSNCFGHEGEIFGWNWLLKNFLTISVENRKEIQIDVSRNHTSNNMCVTESYVSEEELDTYRYYHPYMYKRKLTDEIIEIFDIGYDKNTNCITFPVRDIFGNTLFIARRNVATKFFNYPQGVDKPVYGLYELYRIARQEFHCIDTHIIYDFPKEIIICESMIDALTCWVYGKYAVALNGLGNELQFKQLNDMPCRKFILATDMDEAGQKARARIKYNIRNKIITEYVWDVKKAKDINDMDLDMFNSLKEVF